MQQTARAVSVLLAAEVIPHSQDGGELNPELCKLPPDELPIEHNTPVKLVPAAQAGALADLNPVDVDTTGVPSV